MILSFPTTGVARSPIAPGPFFGMYVSDPIPDRRFGTVVWECDWIYLGM